MNMFTFVYSIRFMRFLSTFIIAITCISIVSAQDAGRISGALQSNVNFFMKDSAIHASGTPQYEYQLYSADSWLNVNYNRGNFEAGIRLDGYNNSYLFNPNGGSYTAVGIGNWYVGQQIRKLNIRGGYIYDQIGSGIIYRAYEERPLAIDNALFGVRVAYDITPDWKIKAFTGKQKYQFDTYGEIIKGINVEGFISPKDSAKAGKWSLAPGFGAVARTFDNATIDKLNNALKYYSGPDSIRTYKHNTYAFTLYNTLTAGPFSWYVEGAYKTPDVMYSPILSTDNTPRENPYIKASGTVLYTSLSYAKHGLGITLDAKRTKNFSYKTDPTLLLNRGFINYIPAMSRVNAYRLTARYNPATQFIGEMAAQIDVRYRFNDKASLLVNYSHINDLNTNPLYRELFIQANIDPNKKNEIIVGVQHQVYNQKIYEGKVDVPDVKTITPFVDWLHKFSRKQALRIEASMMITKQDYGSWAYLLAEYSIAPHWTFTVSDMYNYDFNPDKTAKANNFPSVIIFYNQGPNRFSLGYVKQVEGIVCTGGICRYEPAFSGIKATINTTF